MSLDVIVVGAGVAGLSCARTLARAGKRVRTVERSRGVGGRCATRRVGDQPVDHGVAFLHGSTPSFLAALGEVRAGVLDGWPSLIEGVGTPCQPRALSSRERRVAFAEGVNAFPKQLADGLDIERETNAVRLVATDDGVVVHVECGGQPATLSAPDVVLALAGPQSALLLATLAPTAEVASAQALLSMGPSVPCATVIAMYPPDAPVPAWHVLYPTSPVLALVSHDSSKRAAPRSLGLVLQAKSGWSRARADALSDAVRDDLLDEAARLLGPWAARPTTAETHRWRWARTGPEAGFLSPVTIGMGRRCRVALAGELFGPMGGVEAAFLSGERLARRLLDEVT